ncbi:fimbria/pilus periplasmic chaperone [Pantoea sp. FN0307]|uniref:fimbria/pilus periplasmic chaperone n=1 Tax=unclassified Pantoea TaxID=2630326 RepID=UPI003CF98F1A
MKYQYAIILKLITAFVSLVFITQSAFAGMTISGTRIIFPGNTREKTVRTTNKGSVPLLAQVWVDDGGKNDDINSIKVPFTVTPPIYRVEPGKGQSVRLIYNGMSLPQDRESVFWFNLLEIPPENEAVKELDRLELAFRTRIKIFYRPSALKSGSIQEVEQLKWEIISPARGIKVINPTPYYISFDSAYITSGSTKSSLAVDMIPPFGSKEMLVNSKASRSATIDSVTVRLISDYGSIAEYQLLPTTANGLTISKLLK